MTAGKMNIDTSYTSANSANNRQGIYIGDGGFINQGIAISQDFILPHFWNQIFIDAAGDVVVELGSGAPFVFPAMSPGAIICVGANKILKTATINGTVYNTTCTQMRWGTPCDFKILG